MYMIGEISEMCGLPISTLRYYDKEGSSTYPKRKALFERRHAVLEEEMRILQQNLDMIKFKCWYYDQAIADGNEERLTQIIPDGFPEEIKRFYENAHEE